MLQSFDFEEFLSLARSLEQHHAIFNKLWSIGKPIFTEELPTAGVYFDRLGECIEFKINPFFWQSLNYNQKQFVISHECLHVILYHGFRISSLSSNQDRLIANKALDIVVNHTLIDKFGFDRQTIDPSNKYCWVDTVFPQNTPPSDKYYEYYYNLLEKQSSTNNFSGGSSNSSGGQVLDDHDALESFNTSEFENKIKEMSFCGELESLSNFVKSHTSDIQNQCQEAGCSPGTAFMTVSVKNVIVKKKWETVIKKWSAQYLKDKDEEQWVRKNRRLMFISDNLFLPSEQETENFKKDRIKVWFFQDTSGSCVGFAKRFFTAAKSLPTDRFDVKMHCFDTRVYKTSLESGKLYGFGGTTFTCINNYINNEIAKDNLKYPEAIFIITDGYGNLVSPPKPENWYWFLSCNYTDCIPKESKIFKLSDYE